MMLWVMGGCIVCGDRMERRNDVENIKNKVYLCKSGKECSG